jgi:hypothetical protein
MKFSAVVFGLVYLCAYVVVLAKDWALFIYYPQVGQFSWGWSRVVGIGPGMAWYGLMASAAAVALPVAVLVPGEKLAGALRNSLWLFPCAAMIACVYLMKQFFIR